MNKEIELGELLKEAQMGKEKAAQLLCASFTGLVKKMARRYSFVVWDAEQEAWLAFWEAVKSYDQDAGIFFPWYAQQKVRFALVNLGKKNKFFGKTEAYTEISESEDNLLNIVSDRLLWEKIQKILLPREYDICCRVLVNKESKVEIAKDYQLSRQSINEIFRKAVRKLKKTFLSLNNVL